MAAEERDPHRDPLSDESGSHPVGTGVGAAGGAVAGAAAGMSGGPLGMAAGGVVGAVVGSLAGRAAAGRGDHRHSGTADRGLEKPALHGIVIDDKYGLGHRVLDSEGASWSAEGKSLFKICPPVGQF